MVKFLFAKLDIMGYLYSIIKNYKSNQYKIAIWKQKLIFVQE